MSRKLYGPWPKTMGLVLGGLMVLGSWQLGAAQSPAATPPTPAATAQSPAATPPPPAAVPPVIRLEKNQLSVQITKHTLAEVLTALNQVVPLRVYYRGSEIAALRETKVSMTYNQEPLLVGIKRLLEGQNYMINYTPGTPGAKSATGDKVLNIWFLSGTGTFSLLKPEAETADAATTEAPTAEAPSVADLIQTTLTAKDDEVRWNAIEELINSDNYQHNPEIVQTLWTALRQDKDPDMRRSALDGLEEVADADASFEALATVFQTDKNAGVRGTALNLLVQKYGLASKKLVQQALQDSSKELSSYASALQRELEALETSQSNSSPPAPPQQ